jgi:hypothetical protein
VLALRAAKDNMLKKAKVRSIKRAIPKELKDLEWEADQKLRGKERAEAQKVLDELAGYLGVAET